MLDTVKWTAHAVVRKWDPDAVAWVRRHTDGGRVQAHDLDLLKVEPYEVTESGPNLVTTAGLTRIASLIIAGGGQALTATATRIGVGNGVGSAAVGDTDLSASAGSGNRYFRVLDSTYPSASGAQITLQATFGAGEANFAWNEWCIDVGTPTVTSGATVNPLLVNHKTGAALGTKSAGFVWALQPVIQLS